MPAPDDARPAVDLFAQIYDRLRILAAQQLRRERRGHTLQPTALVHEVFVKMAKERRAGDAGEDPRLARTDFLRLAARAMRQVLVDHARVRGARKRGHGDWHRVTLDDELTPGERGGATVDALVLHNALEQLASVDARMAQIVEFRFFGGLGNLEIAAALGLSERTIEREWRVAKAWLSRALHHGRPA